MPVERIAIGPSRPTGVDTSLRHIAVHMGGSIQYELVVPPGAGRRIALALCEGWWNEAGQRVQTLRVEGTEPKTIDLVADLGQNKAEAYWFEAQDANRDGRIDISIDAAPQAADKNTILNGLWVFYGRHTARHRGTVGRQAELGRSGTDEHDQSGRTGAQRRDHRPCEQHRHDGPHRAASVDCRHGTPLSVPAR